MTTGYSAFGRLVTRWDIENAVVLTLQRHMQPYLDAVWAQHPSASAVRHTVNVRTIYGSLDIATWMPEIGPGIIVNATPTGQAMLLGSGQYYQWYEVSLSAMVQAGDEHDARRLADLYGAAMTAVVAQHGDLAGLSESTTLAAAPQTDFIDPDERRWARSASTFRVLVPVVDSSAGVAPWAASGTVTQTNVVVTAVDLDAVLPQDSTPDGRADHPYSEPVDPDA